MVEIHNMGPSPTPNPQLVYIFLALFSIWSKNFNASFSLLSFSH